jgi:hypothetical protein
MVVLEVANRRPRNPPPELVKPPNLHQTRSDEGPSASSQESIPLDEEEVFAEELNRQQGGGPSYPSSLSSMSQTWMY